MNITFKTELEVAVEVEITAAYPGCKPTRDDPGCGPEIDFNVYVINSNGERELLQDCILEKNIDVLYDDCIQEIQQSIIDSHDYYADKKYHAMKDDGRLFHRRSKK